MFDVYKNHPIAFTTDYLTNDNFDKLDELDSSFIYYLIYGKAIRVNDIDHIMPKSILQDMKYDWEKINSIKNFQLLDYGTNRGDKNAKPFLEWISTPEYVKNKEDYIKIHLIPLNQDFWKEENFESFTEERRRLIIEKIRYANSLIV